MVQRRSLVVYTLPKSYSIIIRAHACHAPVDLILSSGHHFLLPKTPGLYFLLDGSHCTVTKRVTKALQDRAKRVVALAEKNKFKVTA